MYYMNKAALAEQRRQRLIYIKLWADAPAPAPPAARAVGQTFLPAALLARTWSVSFTLIGLAVNHNFVPAFKFGANTAPDFDSGRAFNSSFYPKFNFNSGSGSRLCTPRLP
ncbi:hypothetical protein EVAR_22149_1 [Eumeta japonica]|uniref:Uncharacterized protein n=1 Tax=Eumeta variegata TaxID=151549 RepID=A0A4C1W2H9_EUMVA|nr:hypothetical protein EVAR_22149_1 [Eumeta japonica]